MAFTLSDIPTFELRNGVRVDLTEEERNSMLTAWNEDLVRIEETQLQKLRQERNAKLAETDWEIVMHKEKGTNIPTTLKTYRQALRDITNTYTSLDDVVWPEKP